MQGLITYDSPHLKTQQILESAHNNISLIITVPLRPFKSRNVILNHRPPQFTGLPPQELSEKYSIECVPLNFFLGSSLISSLNRLIVGGCGLLPESITSVIPIVNCHSGLIPQSRGLDSFKWALHDSLQLGVTIHLINQDVDMGNLIHHELTPIYLDDSISTLATRHYLNEISTLANFLQGKIQPTKLLDGLPINPPHRRMSSVVEEKILIDFDKYKAKYCTVR